MHQQLFMNAIYDVVDLTVDTMGVILT